MMKITIDANNMRTRALRVMFVSCEASSTSGVGRCIADLVTHVDRSHIEPILVTAWPGPDECTFLAEVKQQGIPIIHRDLGRWYPPRAAWGWTHFIAYLKTLRARIWSLARLIEEHKIDVVYTNALPTLDAALAARYAGIPHVWHLHEAVCGNQYLRAYLPCFATRWVIRRFSARVIAVSRDLATNLSDGKNLEGIAIVHNGVNLERFLHGSTNPLPLLHSLELPEGTRLVVHVGIVSEHKGHDTLVRAAVHVIQHLPNTAFLMVGNELEEFGHKLREQIAKAGIGDKFFFLGPRDDVHEIMGQCDMLILPSTQEAFSLVCIEAMACGRPVVATRCGGPEEIVVDGETGYLVPVGDEIALSDRIKRILSDPEISACMGSAGRKRAEEKFSVHAYARNIQKIIQEVAKLS